MIIQQLTSQLIIITPGVLSLPGNTKGWFKWEECSCTIILLMMWGGEGNISLQGKWHFSCQVVVFPEIWWSIFYFDGSLDSKLILLERNSKKIVKPVRIVVFCMLPCKVILYTQDILSKHLMLLLRPSSQGPVAEKKNFWRRLVNLTIVQRKG